MLYYIVLRSIRVSCSTTYLKPVYLIVVYFCLEAGRLARSQYPEGPVTGHLVSGFCWFPWVLEQMLGWFPDSSKLPLHASHIALHT